MNSILLLSVLATAPALQERDVAQSSALEAEIAAALEVAGRKHQRVLVYWGDPASEQCQQLDALLAENRELARKLRHEYRVVRVKDVENEAVKSLAMNYGAVLVLGTPHLTILAADAKVLANADAAPLLADGKFDAAKIGEFLAKHQAPVQQAKVLLDAAQVKAGAEQKRVFVTFEAPECVACHKLDARLMSAEAKDLLAKDFVFVTLDLERTAEAKETMERLKGPREAATPWFVVLDPAGLPIVDSDDVTGSNLGCPQTPEQLEAWSATLKRARQHLTDEEVEQIVGHFRKAAETDGKAGARREREKPRS